MNPNYILFAIPFFLLTILAEFIYGRFVRKDYYSFEDFITNMNLGIGSQAFSAVAKGFIIMLYAFVYENWAFLSWEASVLSFLVCLVAYDFLFYWAHRWGHEWNFYWGAHIVHHQSEEYNLSVALRQPWFHQMIAFVIFMPLPFLGFEPIIFAGVTAFATLYQYWIHTRHIGKLKLFDYIFNSPTHHRVHHATNPQYLDKNYGAVFIIWDRMFGTYKEEVEEPIYGITVPLKSLNPVWANIHFYVEIWKGMKLTKGLWNKIKLLFQGPEHLGHLLGQIDKKKVSQKVEKYVSKVPVNLQIYVLVQFLVLIYGVVVFMGSFDDLSWAYRIVFLSLIILTTLNCGAILENKKWINLVEIARFLIFLPVYNVLYFVSYPDWLSLTLPISSVLAVGCMVWLTLNWKYNNTGGLLMQPQKVD